MMLVQSLRSCLGKVGLELNFLSSVLTPSLISRFGSRSKRDMPHVSYVIVFPATIWFSATTTTYNTFLALGLTRRRPIFLLNFATSVASILLAKLSLAATVYRRLDMASFVTN
jgi:hypothetical protein